MFALPWMLGFLALGGVPIIIHLIFRQRYRRIQWAAMDFLMQAIKRTRRRLRLENLLLLFLRVLAVLLMVLAAAVPTFSGEGADMGGSGSKHTVLVVDTSYSMGYLRESGNNETSYAQAIGHARDVIGTLKQGDALTIIAAGATAESISHSPYTATEFDSPQKIDKLLSSDKLALSSEPTHMAGAMAVADEVLAASSKTVRELIILSDLQKSTWVEAGVGEGDQPADVGGQSQLGGLMQRIQQEHGATINLLDVGEERWENFAVESLEITSNVVTVGIPVTIEATIWNPGALPRSALGVELWVGGPDGNGTSLKETRNAEELEPGERAAVQFTQIFYQPGTFRVAAVIRGDGLRADDSRVLSVDVVDSVNILLVSGTTGRASTWYPDELGYFHDIIEPSQDEASTFRVFHISESELKQVSDFSPFRVIIFGNVASCSQEQLEKLEAWTRQGGGLLITAGEELLQGGSGSSFYNETLWRGGEGLLPARITSVQSPDESNKDSPELVVSESAHDHPLLRRLLDAPGIFRAYVRKHLGVTIPDRDDVRVLLDFTADEVKGRDAFPFLVERSFDAGKVLLFTTTADEEWSDLMQYPIYPVLVTEMVRYLAARPRPQANVRVGDTLTGYYPKELAGEAILNVPQPVVPGDLDGRLTVPPVNLNAEGEGSGAHAGRASFRYGGTAAPGFYVLNVPPRGDGDAGMWDTYAVNLDPREGDLTRINESELRAIAPEIELKITPNLRDVTPAEAAASEFPGWRVFLWILLGVLLLETFLARHFGDFGGRPASGA